MPACRSSGKLTADTLVLTGSARVASFFVHESAGSTAEIAIYDNTAASGAEIARVGLTSGDKIDIDLHGVMVTNGIYFKKVSGAVNMFINFY